MGDEGMRVGEASHPGPPLTIKTANVTSLMPHLPFVADFECDVVALEETRLTIDGQKIVNEELVKRGWTPGLGKPQPTRKGTCKSLLDARQGGAGTKVREIVEELKETGRWMSSVVHDVSLYGHAGATEGGEAAFLKNFSGRVSMKQPPSVMSLWQCAVTSIAHSNLRRSFLK